MVTLFLPSITDPITTQGICFKRGVFQSDHHLTNSFHKIYFQIRLPLVSIYSKRFVIQSEESFSIKISFPFSSLAAEYLDVQSCKTRNISIITKSQHSHHKHLAHRRQPASLFDPPHQPSALTKAQHLHAAFLAGDCRKPSTCSDALMREVVDKHYNASSAANFFSSSWMITFATSAAAGDALIISLLSLFETRRNEMRSMPAAFEVKGRPI